jgi:hypothetical protein
MVNIFKSLTIVAVLAVSTNMSAQEVIKQDAVNAAEQMQNNRVEPTSGTTTTADSKATPTAADSKQNPPAAPSKQEPKKTDAKKESSTAEKKDAASGSQKMAINEQGVPTKTKPKAKQTTKTDSTSAPKTEKK